MFLKSLDSNSRSRKVFEYPGYDEILWKIGLLVEGKLEIRFRTFRWTYSLPVGCNFLFEIPRYCLNITNLVFAFFKWHSSICRTYHRWFIWRIRTCSIFRTGRWSGIWRCKIWTWFFFIVLRWWVIINDEILWEVLWSLKNNSFRSVVPLSLLWWLKLSFRGFILKYMLENHNFCYQLLPLVWYSFQSLHSSVRFLVWYLYHSAVVVGVMAAIPIRVGSIDLMILAFQAETGCRLAVLLSF